MATLNWVGKQAVINHDKEVPFKLLKKVKSASVGTSQNLIVHGDNLEALKALMPHYQGKVKCIYIDPPYNTGNEGWVYNDKVNSPKIRQWLGKVVGRQSEDLNRHDKWLCMIYPRLKILRDLLDREGVIFVSIDENEHCNLRAAMDEIFGEENFITTFIWNSKLTGGHDSVYTNIVHEYVVCYAKQKELAKLNRQLSDTEYPEHDEKTGRNFKWDSLWTVSHGYTKNCDYPIKAPDGTEVYPWMCHKDREKVKGIARWFWSLETYRSQKEELIIKQDKNNSWKVYKKVFGGTPIAYQSVLPREVVGGTSSGKKSLEELFGKVKVFDNPKSVELIKHLLSIATNKNDLILDSFAGAGTTGHAILELNKEDGGSRQFVLIEMEDKVAKEITAERVKRAIKKYDYKDGFEYCELDKPLFNEEGQIEDTCDFKQFATYIYFTETQTNIDPAKISGNYIGENGSAEYYLIYKEPHKNDLDKSFLKKLSKTDAKKIVYADRCTLDEADLAEYNLVFKQIPYEVKVF